MTYTEWIASKIAAENPLGRCAAWTTEMVSAFPELRRVPGHVYTVGWGRRAHWWCETPDGTIVDPTASQFPGACVDYEPFEAGQQVRVGRCMNCGEDLYVTVQTLDEVPHKPTFCGDACADDMAKVVGW